MEMSRHQPTAFVVRVAGSAGNTASSRLRLRLRPTEDGWSLLDPAGAVVFRGQGVAGRRHCLQFARERGVISVFT